MIVKVSTAKEKIRSEYKAKRLGLQVNGVSGISRIICRRLLAEVDWAAVRSVHIYKPISKLNEIDTSAFINKLAAAHPHISISLGGQKYISGLPAEMFEVIIVPVLAFDKDKYRLGWGRGWYDRFLAGQSQAQKIGLAYQSSFAAAGLPHEAHDIKLDKIITEKKVY